MRRLFRELDLGGTIVYRTLALVIGFGSGLVIIAIVTRQFGAGTYAAFALLASLINLLPFADLGLGASVLDTVSDERAGIVGSDDARFHASRARDVLLLVAIGVAAAAVAFSAFGLWRPLLGDLSAEPGIATAATFTLCCVAAGIPFALGARILQGQGRMRRVVQIATLGPIVQISGCGILVAADADGIAYAYLPGIGYLAVAIGGYIASQRGTSALRLLPPFRALLRAKEDRIALGRVAVPFLIISVAFALGFQSHRLILARFGDVVEVAQYGIVAQFAGPVLTIVTIAAQNMWSHYRTTLGDTSLTVPAFRSHVLTFGALGLAFGVALCAALLTIEPILTGDVVRTPLLVVVAAAAYVAVVAVHQPSAMLLTSPSGLWTQAALLCAASALAVGVMIPLIDVWGAAAPYLAFAGSMLTLQVVPSIALAIRTIRRSAR